MDAILSAHITHKSVGVEKLELIGSRNVFYLLSALRKMQGVRECVVLKTCNRVEIYTVTNDWEATRRELEVFVNSFIPYDSHQNLVQFLSGNDSIRHLLRVSSGLESMIIGEDQIQSQVKEAFDVSCRDGCIGPILSIVFRKAISVGKKVRSETRLSKGCVSVGSAAVELAESKLGPLKGRNVLVIGAGEMATLVARHLIGKEPEAVFVSSRTYSRAVELAFALNGKAVRFDSLLEFLAQSDVVLCATSATHMILEKRHIDSAMEIRNGRGKLMIIDVSMPRNVAPDVADIPGVELYDIDGLRGVAADNIVKRKGEVKDAERIIGEELQVLSKRLDEMAAEIAIGSLYQKFNDIKEREVRKALNRIKAGETSENVVEDFANSLIYRFLADPTQVLKGAAHDGDVRYSELVKELFKVEADKHVPREPNAKTAHAAED
ncbi:MAG TPA: glutamyl-tRNA reductase [Methanomassiliicoccales archaeon]|nr:glutamyl-tRNA reductase [Methanomassiliicoccales archaeon]